MVRVVFIQPDCERAEVQVEPGTTGMEAARFHGVEGIIGECGGSAACATCHVYVDERSLSKLAPVGAQEDQMLAFTTSQRRFNSRLSCQIPIVQELDGIIFRVPDSQI